ncbi:hypothetical protein T11_5059 [Trichinella zimbabwensis]|uniref:Uncharacterized protein n=1 Tax=Trichinella zimbabwensis TaxID=268475 RepID=A0A0V1I120_9BILA|nr:hypothetical protein T11_5059 [Trichinella zimbabwensis]
MDNLARQVQQLKRTTPRTVGQGAGCFSCSSLSHHRPDYPRAVPCGDVSIQYNRRRQLAGTVTDSMGKKRLRTTVLED